MKIISGSRYCGKTTKLIEIANCKPIYIVCANKERCNQIKALADRMGLTILPPIAVSELYKLRGCSSSVEFAVDEVSTCFERLFPNKKFICGSETIISEDIKEWSDSRFRKISDFPGEVLD